MSLCTVKKKMSMSRIVLATILVVLAFAPASYAAEGVISGFFRGNEQKAPTIGFFCDDGRGTRYLYRSLAAVTASTSGVYEFTDTGYHYGLDTQLAVYTSFDPENPAANQVGYVSDGVEDERKVSLQSGINYTVVIQACGSFSDRRGEWSFAYAGPGTLNGPHIFPAPAYASGNFDGSDPLLSEDLLCGQTDYQVTGPIRVPRTGEYVYGDSSVYYALDICLAIYQDGFNASQPYDNLLGVFDDGGRIRLETGVDYYLLTQPLFENNTGEFRYVLMGPSEAFQITEGISGAWYNAQTPGQGMLMEAYPDIRVLFAAWFTWETTPPDDTDTAVIGDPSHRWLTVQGAYQGDTATLPVYVTRGGIFDDPAPVTDPPEVVGTMTIQFAQCNAAQVSYEVDGITGSFSMSRVANDNNATCEAITNQQKLPFESQ